MLIVVGLLFQDDSGDELKMSEEEAAKVNEMLDDAARSAVNRLDLRSGFYTDPSAAGSWHHMSDEDITGSYIPIMIIRAPFLDFCHGLIDIFCVHILMQSFTMSGVVILALHDEVCLLNFESSLLLS